MLSVPGAPGSPALFLDRDGVINVDHGYVYRPEQFEFLPGIFDLVRFAVHELAWPVIVTTNQSGIGRGYFDEGSFQTLTDWMCDRFRREGAPISRVYHCPYHPVHGLGRYRIDHAWRKPKPGMFLQAAADLSIDLTRSAAIGDRISDIEAAAVAGIPLRLLIDPRGATPAGSSDRVVRTVSEALSVLRSELAQAGEGTRQT